MERPGFRKLAIPMNSVRMQLVEYYYDLRHFLPFDYVVTSSSVRGRYEAAPRQYPRQIAFYAQLDRYAELERSFEPGPNTRGPLLRFYRLRGEGKQRLLADRGPLPEKDYLEFRDRLHAPQFFKFMLGVAQRAEQAKMWALAARYLDALLETAGPSAGWREDRWTFLGRSAQAHVRAGQNEKALQRIDTFLESQPPEPSLLGYRGQALEQLGRLEEARESYAACEREARRRPGQAQWGEWASERRVQVERLLSGGGTKP